MGLVVSIDQAKKTQSRDLPSGEHDSRVVAEPLVIECCKTVYRFGQRQNNLPVSLDQRIHPTSTSDIEIHVDSSKVVKKEISDRVGSLDIVFVGIVHLEERGVVGFHKLVSGVICPQHVFTGCQLTPSGGVTSTH
jgi:hypothetical protein